MNGQHRQDICQLLLAGTPGQPASIGGWVRSVRLGKEVAFVAVNDGSCQAVLQLVLTGADLLARAAALTVGSAVEASGELVVSPGAGQSLELAVRSLTDHGRADQDYPLQKKRHSREFMREQGHLRHRSNLYGAALRLRSRLAAQVHAYFQGQNFLYLTTPIITGNDCEGAGEMFRVTTHAAGPHATETEAEYQARDFFGRRTGLTVSGQLEAELVALGMGKVYTFGPTFRAENSNTSRHAAEFWMVEPEVAFADLAANMALAEDFVRSLARAVLATAPAELEFFAQQVDGGVIARLEQVVSSEFARLEYTEAVRLVGAARRSFAQPLPWGADLATEHERYLAEEVCGGPVFIVNYPERLKPFYMRANDDGRTVAAMDLLVPGVGELIGGSQREERLEVLRARMAGQGVAEAGLWWYLDSRRWGSCPHAGFGLGFERLLMYVSGLDNIRDVVPFPRTPRHAEF